MKIVALEMSFEMDSQGQRDKPLVRELAVLPENLSLVLKTHIRDVTIACTDRNAHAHNIHLQIQICKYKF